MTPVDELEPRTAHKIRHVTFRLWVCVSCGTDWTAQPDRPPARDVTGYPLCESCRRFAGIAP